jgi:hypothetical protein
LSAWWPDIQDAKTAKEAIWAATDYKDEFMLGDKRYCYHLTVSDHASRFLLLFLSAWLGNAALPQAIRSDNGGTTILGEPLNNPFGPKM